MGRSGSTGLERTLEMESEYGVCEAVEFVADQPSPFATTRFNPRMEWPLYRLSDELLKA